MMRRLRATLLCDVRLQLRNGFYYATAFILLVWALILAWLPAADLRWILPPIVLGNLVLNTFYFLAALVLLEHDEGSLHARRVTPHRQHEYHASKLITLTALALAENLLIVVLFHGTGFAWLTMSLAIIIASAVYALMGMIAVARYDSINAFLMPSVLYTAFAEIPLLVYLGGVRHPIVFLHPLQPALLLAEGAFRPLGAAELAYGIGAGVTWCAVLFVLASGALERLSIGRAAVT
jgi:fluoroquinolone transport system permease protein